jgi:hypothetical protein
MPSAMPLVEQARSEVRCALLEQDAPSDGDKHPDCFSCFHLAADELYVEH